MVSWDALGEVLPAGQERGSFPSASTNEATSAVQCPVLDSPVEENGHTGKTPAMKGHEDD